MEDGRWKILYPACTDVLAHRGLISPKSCYLGIITQQTLGDSAMGKTHVLREFWQFLKVRKKIWLAPIVVVLVLLSLLIVLTQGSALAPFIYALF